MVCLWSAGSSEGQEPERLGGGDCQLFHPYPQGCSHKFPSSQALLPQRTWLFMEREGSPSSFRSLPRPANPSAGLQSVLPEEAGPRQGTPTSTQAWQGMGGGECRPSLPGALLALQHLTNSQSRAVLEAVLGGQQLPACSHFRWSLPSSSPRLGTTGLEDEAEPSTTVGPVLPPCGELRMGVGGRDARRAESCPLWPSPPRQCSVNTAQAPLCWGEVPRLVTQLFG